MSRAAGATSRLEFAFGTMEVDNVNLPLLWESAPEFREPVRELRSQGTNGRNPDFRGFISRGREL
jgi:hypothetical protein